MISLKKIQNAPRATRKRWFVALTLLAGIVLVFLWVQYLNWNLRVASAPEGGGELGAGFNPAQSLKGIGASIYDAVNPRN